MDKIVINGNDLTIEDVAKVARCHAEVEISKDAKDRIIASRKLVDKFVEEERVIYGITTGFGKFSEVHISKDMTKNLQKNLIMSHSCGVGELFDEDIVRAIILLRANSLSKGYSGARLETIETLVAMLNKGVTPCIPQFDQELRSICQENDVTYVDSTWIVRQKNYLEDGIHMNRTFYRVWFRYLKGLLGNQ